MRTITPVLALLILSGCASTGDSRRAEVSSAAERPTLIHRLGLGHTSSKKSPDDVVTASTESAELLGVVPDDPIPDTRSPVQPPWKSGTEGE